MSTCRRRSRPVVAAGACSDDETSQAHLPASARRPVEVP